MKKLTILFAALTLCAGLWAETVSYLCPVYNDPQDVTKGIQKWETKTADATEITNASATLAAGWYVVKGTDVQTGTLTCQGAVHIILADDAKLTATGNDSNNTPGIQVSGTGNSLTIYAQSMGDQMGQLKATGGAQAAGIGGGRYGSGSNITINGGEVTATGGDYAAGIGGGNKGSGSNININGGVVMANGGEYAAGIGGGDGIGGDGCSGSNITINGGTVEATGGYSAAGIGGGFNGSGSNIKVATYLIVKAGNDAPSTIIAKDRTDDTDIASSLAGKRYVTSKADPWKLAIAEIEAAVKGVTDADILAIANTAIENINKAAEEDIIAIKTQALADLATPIKYYNSGKAAALGAMGEECTDCHAVEVTKGDKTITLYAPDKVKYIKVE